MKNNYLKKILVITNDFPPPIKGGNMRIYKFIKYLKKFDCELFVICNNWDIQSEIQNNSILNSELNGIKFISVPAKGRNKNNIPNIPQSEIISNQKKINYIIKYFVKFLQPDLYKYTWNNKAYKAAKSIIYKENITHLLTTSPPHSTQLIGLKLKNKFRNKISWIADFRDLWSLSHTYPQGFSFKRIYNKYLEKLVLCNADRIIFVSKGIYNLTLKNFNLNILSHKVNVITNGFDFEDFKHLEENILIDKKYINFSYVGSMFGPQAKHRLLEGINAYSSEIHQDENIRFNFIGEFENNIIKLINSNNKINLINKKNHKEALDLMYSSQILILVLPNDFEGKIAYSGKFFEYIYIGKPILAIVPEGEVSYIINTFNLGEVANPDDIIDIKNKIKKIVSQNNCYSRLPNELLYKYSREALTKQLINIINES